MCGIAGFASPQPAPARALLERMSRALAHRGPDGDGMALWDERGRACSGDEPACAGLAHRRLSIIDLSAAGRQPMANEDGTLWITFNGEVYNFGELRPPLEQAGHAFRSHTDTEIILHLVEQHGLGAALPHMNGMFAFALWNTRERELLLARDRLGKKPLYYLHRPDGSLHFASELKAFAAAGLVDRTDIDPVALAQIWQYGYAFGERTIYRGIRRLRPGHHARWKDGRLTTQRYWNSPFAQAEPRNAPLEELADELEALLCDAIRLRLIADVPLGLFLSGGIDSSLVAALAARVAGRDLKTFSIAFREAAFNEAPHARAVANHLGLPNETMEVTDSLRDSFETIGRQFDKPFGDSSAIPTWFLCRQTRRHVTVALSGDGGDELFAGYSSYAQGLRVWGNADERRLAGRAASTHNRAWEFYLRCASGGRWPIHWTRQLNARRRARLFTPDFARAALAPGVAQDRMDCVAEAARADLLTQMQHLDVSLYLPDDILVKVDHMSMAHALECRCPLLDHRVVEFAARLPRAARMGPGGRGKEVLRTLLARHVPRELFERPKQGFSIPWNQWCTGETGAELRRRWEALALPWFKPSSGAELFPSSGLGHANLQWCAFVTLLFFEDRP